MKPRNKQNELPGDFGRDILPPTPREKGLWLKLALIGAAVLAVLDALVFCYLSSVAPPGSSDDAFIDGYVSLMYSRIPGRINRQLITNNHETRPGEVIINPWA
jgi:multidrug resistance efflux pump